MEIQKSYYAIIPANVRYDKELTPNAKLLYAEITALCNEKGYCWATNEYFAKLYGVSKISISRWINQLIKKGYISSEIVYKEGSKEILNRYLKILNDPIKEKLNTPIRKVKYPINKKFNTPIQNCIDPINKKFNTPINKKFKDNNKYINNTINNTINNKEKEKEKITVAVAENNNVTQMLPKCYTDTNIAEITKCYEENIGMITPAIAEILFSYLEDMKSDLICEAIKIASRNNVRKANYINGILKDWNNKGIKTMLDLDTERNKMEDMKPKREETEEEKIARKTKELEEAMKKDDVW